MAKNNTNTQPAKRSDEFLLAINALRAEQFAAKTRAESASTPAEIVEAAKAQAVSDGGALKTLQKRYYMALIDEATDEKRSIQAELDAGGHAFVVASDEFQKQEDALHRANELFDNERIDPDKLAAACKAWAQARRTVEQIEARRNVRRKDRDECDKQVEGFRAKLKALDVPASTSVDAPFASYVDTGPGGRASVEPMN